MKTTIVWFRNDLRVHDHPALTAATSNGGMVVPVFIFDNAPLRGRHAGSNRNRFLLESLEDLKLSLKKLGADLVVRSGKPAEVLTELTARYGADEVYCTEDFTPYSVHRDKTVSEALQMVGVKLRSFPGRLIVDSFDDLHTKLHKIHKIFTPFWKNWQDVGRRAVVGVPKSLQMPDEIEIGELPRLDSITQEHLLSPDVLKGGETAARQRLKNFLNDHVSKYHQTNDLLSIEGTSRLSSYLHFGCLSPREIEGQLDSGAGEDAWHRQLCWREFYHYVLFHYPQNAWHEMQERYRGMSWDNDVAMIEAWKAGKTGYPVVDASMRQLLQQGWMHNRARLIVGSFFTKDLWQDWRIGETHFMNMLIDGDEANNNGNWQWIASVGVDPAPVFRRMYNPTLQQQKFDPDGDYVRAFVPELKHVPDKYLAEPWKMPEDVQREAGCVIGNDYPEPIVDHKVAREEALARFRDITV